MVERVEGATLNKVKLWLRVAGLIVAVWAVGSQTGWRFGLNTTDAKQEAPIVPGKPDERDGLVQIEVSPDMDMCAQVAAATAELQNKLDRTKGESLFAHKTERSKEGYCGFQFCGKYSRAELMSIVKKQDEWPPVDRRVKQSTEYQRVVLVGRRCGIDYESTRDEFDRLVADVEKGRALCASRCLSGSYQG